MLGYNTFQEYTNTYVNQVFIKQPQFIGGASQIQTAMLVFRSKPSTGFLSYSSLTISYMVSHNLLGFIS